MRNITLFTLLVFLITAAVSAQDSSNKKDYHSYPYWIEMMQDPDANFFETQKAFNAYFDGREMTKGNGYKAFKRWEYWMGRKVSPDGHKPAPDRNLKANQLKRSMTTNGNWVTLGPSTVPSGYDGYRGLGRINAIAFHPTDANTIYAGAPAGGLWVSDNDGVTWTTNTDILPTLGISAILVDYSNPNIMYIGTGDRDHGDAPGAGVWKSTDGGITFQPVNTGMTTSTVSRMIMHPIDPNIILAATNDGIFRSVNGGINWVQSASGNYKDIVLKPGDPNIVYATSSGSFFRSTNNGISFNQISTGLTTGYRGAIAVSPANPNYVYFWLTNSDSFKGLYRSTDSGLTFSVRSTSPNIMSWDCNGGSGGQAWYDLDMACDPTNADIIYGGGVNCFKSTNGGQTWAINSHWYGGCGVPSVHADLHVLEYNPLNNKLYAGNDGGVYWTANGGISWTEISNGLVISQAYKIGQSKTSRNSVINGYQDNGTSTYTETEWVNVNGGDGMECAYDPADESYSYSSLYYGAIYRHLYNYDDGQIAGEGVNGITEDGAWVTPFVIDHNDGNTMFIGYDNVWRSTNIKDYFVSWTKISNINANDLDGMCQSDANTNILYVSNDNYFYRTDDCKATSVIWTDLTFTLPSANYITAIETSPVDENVVYLVQQNHVYKSTNKGASWTDITGNLPDVQMNTLVYYHSSNEGLYLGTDIGVFYRDADNPSWIEYSTGLPAAVWVTDLEIYSDPNNQSQNILRAGTFGRGLWESTLINASAAPGNAGEITGPAIVCQGQSQVTYSVEDIPNATSYVWTLPEGVTGSSTSNSITVDFSSTAISDEISVYGTNQYGSGEASALFVTVNQLPEQAGAIAGDNSLCQGESSVIYTVEEIANATSYEWILPDGASGSSTSNSILVDFYNSGIGLITVYGINDCGIGLSSSLEVTINEKPVTPSISNIGHTIYSDAPEGNQWFDQSGLIQGANEQEYIVTWDGDYFTVVTLNECSSDPSNTLTVIVTDAKTVSVDKSASLYPNPVSNELTVELVGNKVSCKLEVINPSGQIIYTGNIIDKAIINTSIFIPGIYVLKITGEETTEFLRFIKQ